MDDKPTCECDGCGSATHKDGGRCQSDFDENGDRWERKKWPDHEDRLLCPACWEQIAATQSSQPGLAS